MKIYGESEDSNIQVRKMKPGDVGIIVTSENGHSIGALVMKGYGIDLFRLDDGDRWTDGNNAGFTVKLLSKGTLLEV